MRTLSFEPEILDGLSCLSAGALHGHSKGPERAYVVGQAGGVDARLALYCGLFWRLSSGSARVAWLGQHWSAVAGEGVERVDAVVDARVRVRAGVGALRELRSPGELLTLLERLPGERPVVGLLGIAPLRLGELADMLEEPWPVLELLDGGELLLVLQLARSPGERDQLRLVSPDPDLETDLELALVELNALLVAFEGGAAVLPRLARGGGFAR